MLGLGRKSDVFVIGGGPAGLAAAIAARRRGMSVTVADGMSPPVDKACGEGMMPETVAALRELGVQLRPEEGFPFRGIRFLENGHDLRGDFEQGPGLAIRRTKLHEWLIRCAEECGIRLLWQTPVAGISDAGVHLASGFVGARWIVGADGSSSRVRLWSGLNRPKIEKHRFASRRHYHVAPWSDYVQIYWAGERQAYVTPISREEICIVITGDTAEGGEFNAFLNSCPELAARLAGAEVSSRERGAVTLTHSLHSVSTGNVVLVGDASGGVDAITGEGLRLAFRQALALAAALETNDLDAYARAHRQLYRKPALAGHLLLQLGRKPKLRARAFSVLAGRRRLFADMLAIHSGNAVWGDLLSAGAQFGWRALTT